MKQVLDIRDLSKQYYSRKSQVHALSGVSLQGHSGEILGVLGPNGSGKTSLIKSIASIINYDGGRIQICGIDNRKHPQKALAHIGAVLEGARNIYWKLSPVENIRYFAGIRGLSFGDIQQRMEFLLDSLELEDVKNKEVEKFSRGMQQKVAIACALVSSPKVLLLDEPTLGLDVEISRKMKKWLKDIVKKESIFVLVTSHDMNFIESVCDNVVIIKKGRMIKQDSVDNLKSLFAKKRYKVSIEGELTDEQIKKLKTVVDYKSEPVNGNSDLIFHLSDTSVFYSIIEVLRIKKQEILKMDILQDDFEDVFLDIVNQSNPLQRL